MGYKNATTMDKDGSRNEPATEGFVSFVGCSTRSGTRTVAPSGREVNEPVPLRAELLHTAESVDELTSEGQRLTSGRRSGKANAFQAPLFGGQSPLNRGASPGPSGASATDTFIGPVRGHASQFDSNAPRMSLILRAMPRGTPADSLFCDGRVLGICLCLSEEEEPVAVVSR
jgi:hypothetical protein